MRYNVTPMSSTTKNHVCLGEKVQTILPTCLREIILASAMFLPPQKKS